jgi:hypothetical protein
MITWMVSLVASTAWAAAPAPELVAVTPITMPGPERPVMLPTRESWSEGWLVTVRVDPATRVHTQGLAPQWWIGDQPVYSWGSDPVGGCAVFLVEGPVDLSTAPMFLGPAELAERVDLATARRRLQDAERAGAVRWTPAELAAHTAPRVTLARAGAISHLMDVEQAKCMGTPPPPEPVILR